MLKKMKKAFTITELVIVIAVIAILAAVLIPTFTTVVDKANESAAMQEARSEFENFNVEALTSESDVKDFIIKYQKDEGSEAYYFVVTEGQFDPTPVELGNDAVSENSIMYNDATYNLVVSGTNDFNNYEIQNEDHISIYEKAPEAQGTQTGA